MIERPGASPAAETVEPVQGTSRGNSRTPSGAGVEMVAETCTEIVFHRGLMCCEPL